MAGGAEAGKYSDDVAVGLLVRRQHGRRCRQPLVAVLEIGDPAGERGLELPD